jgi:hypothetical protein
LASGCAGLYQRPSTHETIPPERFGQTFTPEELGADLAAMRRVFEEVHPDLYYFTTPEVIDRRMDEALAALEGPMTRVEFFPVAARFAASFGDGHTYAGIPFEEWSRHVSSGAPVFPFEVEWREDALLLLWVGPEEDPVAPGDELLSVDGIPAQELVSTFLAQRSSPVVSSLDRLSASFQMHLWLNGIEAPFAIECRTAEGPVGLEREGIPFGVLHSRRAAEASYDYDYERIRGDVGYLDFRRMVDGAAFDELLERAFADLRAHPPAGLIVDLRQNPGGDSRLGQALLDYVNDQPYRMAASKHWKMSARMRSFLKQHVPAWLRWLPLQHLHPMGRKLWSVPEGEIVVLEGEVVQPGENALRFDGPVCVLIGPRTASSATMTADAIEAFDLATLLGEETGAVPNAFGEIYPFDLPGTHLPMGVSSALFVRASGDATDRRGVRPDIEVVASAADVLMGRDEVLELALDWVREEAARRP